MRKLLYSLLAITLSATGLRAQEVDVLIIEEESTPITLSGSVDTYFRSNLNSPNRAADGIRAPTTSFANLPGFSLGMVNLIAGYEGEKVGFVADLVFGPRGSDAVFNSGGSSSIVNQLYTYWKVSDAVTLTLGNFNTFLGYEVISPTANFNYSTSYMFSYGPFSHTGLKADFALTDEFSLALAVMNPTDFTEFNPVASYTLGGQLGYSTDAGSVYLNLLYGDQDGPEDQTGFDGPNGNTFQADITAGFDLSETLFLGVNTTINTTAPPDLDGVDLDNAGFLGVAGYLQLSPSETFAIGIRGEYFSEFGGGVGALALDENGDGSVFDFTLSSNINVGGGLTLIPEFRIDIASEEPFENTDFEGQSSLASFLLAAVYSF